MTDILQTETSPCISLQCSDHRHLTSSPQSIGCGLLCISEVAKPHPAWVREGDKWLRREGSKEHCAIKPKMLREAYTKNLECIHKNFKHQHIRWIIWSYLFKVYRFLIYDKIGSKWLNKKIMPFYILSLIIIKPL